MSTRPRNWMNVLCCIIEGKLLSDIRPWFISKCLTFNIISTWSWNKFSFALIVGWSSCWCTNSKLRGFVLCWFEVRSVSSWIRWNNAFFNKRRIKFCSHTKLRLSHLISKCSTITKWTYCCKITILSNSCPPSTFAHTKSRWRPIF